MKLSRRRFGSAACFAIALTSIRALALEAPRGKVVLTITGNVAQPNAGSSAAFDMPMLQKLPQHSFTTKTPWYPEAKKFTGPYVRDVLAAAGAKGRTLRAIALNDYKVEIPAEDVEKFDVLLALAMDDKPMPVRDKGPLFIIYPFDSVALLRSEKYFSRAAWQLKAIEVH